MTDMTSPIQRRTLLRQGLGAGLAVAWPLRSRAAPLQTIRIGVANAPVGNPPMMSSASSIAVSRAKGWVEQAFAADGTKIEWTFFKGTGPAVNEALTNDQLDFAYQGDLPALIGRASGLRACCCRSRAAPTSMSPCRPRARPARSPTCAASASPSPRGR
jgi:sulfonate transport system substrate-binding protein